MPRIATVFIATGQQASRRTRDASSASARALADIGCEVVEARFDDKEALKRAVTGAECVFLVTYPLVDVPEIAQGINVIDVSKEAGVKFLVFSTLPSMTEISNGKFKDIGHFDDKSVIQKHLEASGLPCACICPGGFLRILSVGDARTVLFYTWINRDMGLAVKALFTQYTMRLPEIDHRTFVLGCCRLSAEGLAAELAKVLGKPVEVKRVHTDVKLINDMFDFCIEHQWFPEIPVPDPRLEALGVKVGTIEEFARTELKPWAESL
ncbi:hypothetical protein BD626DRAFT_592181 [Schizophyllum amplum]|uniref:NmrA-like domain-containing protein n=1 Tax=Schizophyllum amplum TaxID=97359 RepID=A0A550CEQ2_9AGAR|nr:hypothetical protein BD626DRAFT_592181 [Auriculariopsis ampla]